MLCSVAAFAVLAVAGVASDRSTAHAPLPLCSPQLSVNCNGHSMVTPTPKVNTAAACCNICVKTPGCTAWTWNGPNGNLLCYPKLNCTSPKYNNSGVQSGGAPPAPPSPHPKPPPPSPPPPPPPPPARPAEHPGILDVVKEFGVDNTGKTDVTVKLQAAITAAYDQQLACFFPPG
eukprot:gene11868-22144_t